MELLDFHIPFLSFLNAGFKGMARTCCTEGRESLNKKTYIDFNTFLPFYFGVVIYTHFAMNHNQMSCATCTTPEWDFPLLSTGARMVIYGFFSWFCGFKCQQARQGELSANFNNTSGSAPMFKRACTSLAEGKIKEFNKLKAPRGMYSAKTPPAESPPTTKSPPPHHLSSGRGPNPPNPHPQMNW